MCSTSLSALVCERAEKPSPRRNSAMTPAIYRAAQIAAHRLRAGDPVVAAGAFHRVVALVDQHHHRIAVIGRRSRLPSSLCEYQA